MEYRQLGKSGLRVPVLSFGTGTFGGSGPLFSNWGNSDAAEARRLIDISMEAGVNLYDTADVYSNGASEEVLGEAVKGRRDSVLISTKTSLPMGDGPNETGSSRFGCFARWMTPCAALRPTISTSCNSMPSMPSHRLKKCCRRSIRSSAPARCAIPSDYAVVRQGQAA